MSTPKWQPGKLYAPGSLVVPRTTAPSGVAAIPNPGFDSDASGWTLIAESGATIAWQSTGGYQSPGCVKFESPGSVDRDGSITLATAQPVVPGQSISCSVMASMTGSPGTSFRAAILWYNSTHTLISNSAGPDIVLNNSGGGYKKSSASGAAPAGAAYFAIAVWLNAAHNTTIYVDNFAWNYTPPSATGLMYKAVQAASGYSATAEPSWPSTLGVTVVDNEVTWEAVSLSRVVWKAIPLMTTCSTAPDFSGASANGEMISDCSASWEAVDMRITDENCPNTKVVVIAKSKIYAGDGDVVRYSATLNPRDWSSEQDAGYLGTGLMENGANEVAVLALYRGNLVVMNSTSFQQWNIDPDPALMDLLDTMDGIGSVWHLAAQPVANDLFYLASLGVRTVGISGATNNLRAGDVGLPVDTMIQKRILEAKALGREPISGFYPSSGQYWLVFNRNAASSTDEVDVYEALPNFSGSIYAEVFVYTLNQVGQVGAWTRYMFPFAIDYITQNGDDMYARDGDNVYRISEQIGPVDFAGGGDCGGGGGA